MSGYVYILKDDNGKTYVGSTTDLERRMKQHGFRHRRTTMRMKESKLVLVQEYETLAIVRKIEQKIKRLKRKDYIDKMIADGYIAMQA